MKRSFDKFELLEACTTIVVLILLISLWITRPEVDRVVIIKAPNATSEEVLIVETL